MAQSVSLHREHLLEIALREQPEIGRARHELDLMTMEREGCLLADWEFEALKAAGDPMIDDIIGARETLPEPPA